MHSILNILIFQHLQKAPMWYEIFRNFYLRAKYNSMLHENFCSSHSHHYLRNWRHLAFPASALACQLVSEMKNVKLSDFSSLKIKPVLKIQITPQHSFFRHQYRCINNWQEIQQELSSCWDGWLFGHNRHGPKSGGAVPHRVTGSTSNTMSAGTSPTSIPSGILIHPATWPQQIWAEKWGGAVPLSMRGAGSNCQSFHHLKSNLF